MAGPNTFLARWDGGWIERTTAATPRCEAKLSVGAVQSLAGAQAVVDAQLAAHGGAVQQVDLGVETDDLAEQPYTGYLLGDTLSVQAADSTSLGARRTAMVTVTEIDDAGGSVVTPSFVPVPASPGQPPLISELVAANSAVKKMFDGTLRGQSRAAQPFNPHPLQKPEPPRPSQGVGTPVVGCDSPDSAFGVPSDTIIEPVLAITPELLGTGELIKFTVTLDLDPIPGGTLFQAVGAGVDMTAPGASELDIEVLSISTECQILGLLHGIGVRYENVSGLSFIENIGVTLNPYCPFDPGGVSVDEIDPFTLSAGDQLRVLTPIGGTAEVFYNGTLLLSEPTSSFGTTSQLTIGLGATDTYASGALSLRVTVLG